MFVLFLSLCLADEPTTTAKEEPAKEEPAKEEPAQALTGVEQVAASMSEILAMLQAVPTPTPDSVVADAPTVAKTETAQDTK
jgi:hypothetical protein